VMSLVFLEHLFTKASATPNPGKPTIRLLRRTVTVPNLKNSRSQILLNHPLPIEPGRQVICPPFHTVSRFHGRGGATTEKGGGGGFSGCLFLFPLSSICFSIFLKGTVKSVVKRILKETHAQGPIRENAPTYPSRLLPTFKHPKMLPSLPLSLFNISES
jgi:hypothetical protein